MICLVKVFVFVILSVVITENSASLIVKQISIFPHPINKTFHLQIVPNTDNEELINLPGDTIIIQIVDSHGLVKERVLFNYGLYDHLLKEFDGNYIKISKLKVNVLSTAIDVALIFKSRSDLYLFEIYVISTTSKQLHRTMLKDLKMAKRIYQNTIRLLKSSVLDLSFNPIGEDDGSWNEKDVVIASCRYYDGIIKKIPIFNNYQNLSVIASSFYPERNERTLKFTVQLTNHLTTIQCYAGNNSQIHIIKVKHHPSEIYVKPEITETVEANSTFDCYVKDGYPSPRIEWIPIDGPSNASKYYYISRKSSRLHINANIPDKSKWTFMCIIIHSLPKSERKIMKRISFTVNNPEIADLNSNKSKNLNESKVKTPLVQKNSGKSLLEIEKYFNKTFNIFKEEYNKFKFNQKTEIQIIKKELQSIKTNIKSLTENKIQNSSQISEFIKNFQQNLTNQILKIEKQFNIELNKLKQENKQLKNDIKLNEQNKSNQQFQNDWEKNLGKKNDEIKQLKNKFEQLQKFVEMKLIKKTNNLLCEYFSHVGSIVNKGQNGEINEWIIKDYKNLQDDKEEINSTSFYSHDWGYNMHLNIHPNGFGKGRDSYLSLFIRILPGKYDDQLVWPIKDSIKLSLRNQVNGRNYYQKTISLDKNNLRYFKKPTCEGNRFIGYQRFVKLDRLKEEEFLFNDSIIITCELIKNLQ